MFIQQIINGLTLGGIYALFALGYTMVYGILRMINFAHSEIFMVGAYLGFWSFSLPFILQLPLFLQIIITFILALIVSGTLAVVMEKTAYHPLRHSPRLTPLISAIGVSLFLQNLVMLIATAQSKPYPESFSQTNFVFNSVQINTLQILIIGLSLGLMVLLHTFIQRTKLGKAMRAIAQNHQVSQLMGINVNNIISLTFFIGGGLAGIAGVLNGLYYGSVKYNIGFLPGIKAFTAAVLGGIGNIKGAMLGGFVLGVLEALAAGYISSENKDLITFIVLILILIFRPSGILGEDVPEKI